MAPGEMMGPIRDYYEVLGVERTAAPEEIKRSYFGKVRQYPPDRFPEEFKELRAAYDTLSDKEKRAEYDENGSLPESILSLLNQGRTANGLGHHTKAAEFYKTILRLHPELDKVRKEYAWTLEDDGKTGKATEVWEYLCKQCPANAGYARALAESYGRRLWHKKALAQYRRALELDKNDSESWLSLIKYHVDMDERDEAEAVCREALDTVGEAGGIYLYLCAFEFFETADAALAEQSLKNILRKAKEIHPGTSTGASSLSEDDFETIVFGLLNHIEGQESIHLYPYIKELAALLPRINDDQRERLAWAERNYEITTIEEKGFGALFHDILIIRNNEDDSRDARNHMAGMEYILLAEKNTYYSQLLRLKKEYPNLYDLHKIFFDEALTTGNPEKLMLQRTKALARQKLQPVGYTDGEEDGWAPPVETVHRESPKVGRNDPCPCGSGKKYKKCCGA
ncbi:MAG: DnaJ domain-containing protein [Treponema sp.]|jgi:tetratricopeptide (TPR) repeat protein|nr:DnaJ domain-containing protein [Treponema sp.]